MNPINSALWFIESHLLEHLSLESIAAQVDVSPYYLTRAFGELSGLSIHALRAWSSPVGGGALTR